MTNDDLDRLDELHRKASSAPWFVRWLDDEYCQTAVAVSTKPDTGAHESMRADEWPGEEIVAATLVQQPAYVVPLDQLWDENAALIAALRNAAPDLIRLARIGLSARPPPPANGPPQ